MTSHSNLRPRALRFVSFSLLVACVAPAGAVDWSGYFRGGPGATTVHGESRQCYGLNGPGLNYRLGNECDFYGEFQLAQAMKYGGVDFNAVLMTTFYSTATETGQSANLNDNHGIEQAYVEMKGVDFAPQVLFWMGKRRDRLDVYIVNTFFTNMSGVGAGFSNVSLGGGAKFAFSGYKSDSVNVHDGLPNGSNGGGRLHADFYDIAVNPGGALRVTASYSHGDSQGGLKGTSGEGISVEHVQKDFFGGGNHLWVQYSQGSLGLDQRFDPSIPGGTGTLTADSAAKSYRIVESPSWQIGALGGQAIALYQHDETQSTAVRSISVGGRGAYAITSSLKFLAEIGYSQRRPDGAASEHLTKLTIGPALATGPDFWKRPELRLYVTHATYNRAAAADAANGLQAGTTSGTSYGAQVEIWF
ncbi:MAG: maltoporin [Vitreoscilla sp.]